MVVALHVEGMLKLIHAFSIVFQSLKNCMRLYKVLSITWDGEDCGAVCEELELVCRIASWLPLLLERKRPRNEAVGTLHSSPCKWTKWVRVESIHGSSDTSNRMFYSLAQVPTHDPPQSSGLSEILLTFALPELQHDEIHVISQKVVSNYGAFMADWMVISWKSGPVVSCPEDDCLDVQNQSWVWEWEDWNIFEAVWLLWAALTVCCRISAKYPAPVAELSCQHIYLMNTLYGKSRFTSSDVASSGTP